MKLHGKKQKVLHEYKLEIEKMCETLNEIMSLEKSEKYLIPSTLVDRAEYLKEEMTVAIEVIDIDKEEQDRTPLSTIELEIDTEKEYFKEKYSKIIEMVKSSVLDKVSKTHISNFTAIKGMWKKEFTKQKDNKGVLWMKLEDFLYLHCGEHRKICSMDVRSDNYIYSGGAWHKALWRAIKKDIEDKAIEVSGIPIPKLRLKILIGDNPEEVNKYIKHAFIIGLEKEDLEVL